MKLIVSLAVTLTIMAAAATAVTVAQAAPAVARAAAADKEAVAQADIFESNQSPPIWNNAWPGSVDHRIPNDDDLPINFRRGGARGGWGHGHDRDPIGTIHRGFNKKRAVIYEDNAHFSLNNGENAQVETEVEAEAEPGSELEDGAFFNAYKKVKRGDDDADEEDGEEAEGDEQEEEEEEEEVEEEEEEEEEEETELDFQGFQEGDFSFNEFEEDNLTVEEDGDDEEGEEAEEVDEEEEARLDSEAGLQDWIEEMKSEEYFNLAGHPTGEAEEEESEEGEYGQYDEEGEGEDEEEGESVFNEDEPSPSEEELFAASWGH